MKKKVGRIILTVVSFFCLVFIIWFYYMSMIDEIQVINWGDDEVRVWYGNRHGKHVKHFQLQKTDDQNMEYFFGNNGKGWDFYFFPPGMTSEFNVDFNNDGMTDGILVCFSEGQMLYPLNAKAMIVQEDRSSYFGSQDNELNKKITDKVGWFGKFNFDFFIIKYGVGSRNIEDFKQVVKKIIAEHPKTATFQIDSLLKIWYGKPKMSKPLLKFESKEKENLFYDLLAKTTYYIQPHGSAGVVVSKGDTYIEWEKFGGWQIVKRDFSTSSNIYSTWVIKK